MKDRGTYRGFRRGFITPRQIDAWCLKKEGKSIKEIAGIMKLKEPTVVNYISQVENWGVPQ